MYRGSARRKYTSTPYMQPLYTVDEIDQALVVIARFATEEVAECPYPTNFNEQYTVKLTLCTE